MERQKPKRFMRRAAVLGVCGFSTSTLYDEISKGKFPKPVPIGERAVAWIEDEVIAWQAAKIAKRDRQPERA